MKKHDDNLFLKQDNVIYLDKSLDLRRALIENGRARERQRLYPLIGRLVAAVIVLSLSILASTFLGWNGCRNQQHLIPTTSSPR